MSDTEHSESSEESSSDDDSDVFEYSSSSDSDSISSQDDAEEIEIPEDYEREGAESDDDRNKCCHWTTQQQQHSTVRRRRGVPDMGGPSQRYQDGTSPSDLVELVLEDTFLDPVIRCTNNHGQGDQKYSHLISKVFGRRDHGLLRAFIIRALLESNQTT